MAGFPHLTDVGGDQGTSRTLCERYTETRSPVEFEVCKILQAVNQLLDTVTFAIGEDHPIPIQPCSLLHHRAQLIPENAPLLQHEFRSW